MGHTKEPWKTVPNNAIDLMGISHRIVWSESNHYDVCYVTPGSDDNNGNANAARIVACVNALAGISNPDALPELLAACLAQINGKSVDWEEHQMCIRLAYEKLGIVS